MALQLLISLMESRRAKGRTALQTARLYLCCVLVLGAILLFKDRGGCGSDRDRAALGASSSGMLNDMSPMNKAFPKIIHQTWKTCDSFELPAHKAFTQTWKDHHPHWQYRCWNDSDNRALIENHLPQYLVTYDGFPREIYRVDFVRAAYMYVYGGVYVDYDFVSVKPLDPLLELWRPYGVIFGTMGKDNTAPNAIANAFMISKPQHPFWILYMDAMQKRKDNPQVVLATGPDALKAAIVEWYGGRNLHHPGEYQRIINQTRVETDPPLYVASGGMFYPIIWDRYQYENFCCPRDVCLNGRERTSCDDVRISAKNLTRSSDFESMDSDIQLCSREMCADTYAYTIWLSVWKERSEDFA